MKYLLFILAVHSIAHTCATQAVFKPIRDYLSQRVGEYWRNLITCPYCQGYHVAWILLLFYQGFTGSSIHLITGNREFDFFINWMAIAAAANLITWILCDKIKKPKATEVQQCVERMRNAVHS